MRSYLAVNSTQKRISTCWDPRQQVLIDVSPARYASLFSDQNPAFRSQHERRDEGQQDREKLERES